jgi:hypothetical protein
MHGYFHITRRFKMKVNYLGLILVASVALAGCSGSSSSSSSSTPTKVAITSANQSAVTKSAINSATQSFGSSYASLAGGVQTSTSPSNNRTLFDVADFALQKMAQQQSAPAYVIGTVTTTQCTISGNYSVDSTATNFTMTFNSCVDTTNGPVSNGTISITNVSSTATTFSATLGFNFTITSSGTTALSLVGGFTLTETGKGTAAQINTLSGTSLVLTTSGGSFSLTGATANGFNFTDTFNNDGSTPVVHSNDINFAVAVTDNVTPANSFAYSALTTPGKPLVKSSADTYLRSGQIVVTGDASTAIRITILPTSGSNIAGTSTGQVQVELSTNSGSTWGTPTIYTWATL